MRVIFHLPGHELLFGEAAAKLSEIRRKEAPVQKEKKKRVAPVQAKNSPKWSYQNTPKASAPLGSG
jgi:hypothetical protein